MTTTGHTENPREGELRKLLDELPSSVVVGMVALDREGRVVIQQNAERELPTASSIKPLLLIELFVRYADELDRAGRDDIQEIVTRREHPAVAHFGDEDRALIAEELAKVSIKQLGKIMIDSEDQQGKQYANVVYNAASNVAIALLGGPVEATRLIHRRDPAFRVVHLRRYMLADRKVTGDNTATPMALATYFRLVLRRKVAGVEPAILDEVAAILHADDYDDGGKLYAKGGTLQTDPVTRVRAGQYQLGERRLSYAIFASQRLESPDTGKTQFDALSKLTREIFEALKRLE